MTVTSMGPIVITVHSEDSAENIIKSFIGDMPDGYVVRREAMEIIVTDSTLDDREVLVVKVKG